MLPISQDTLKEVIKRLEIADLTTATIRRICSLSAALEKSRAKSLYILR